jgi:iron complex outermembrane receptor protein
MPRYDVRRRRALLCGGALALVLAAPAAAQTQPQVTEIVVTAQRRSERLIDVPAAVSVLGADMLARASVTNTADLAQLTPGLQVSNTGAFTSFSVRGVSSETSGPGADNNVAVYLDGVYYPSKNAGVFDFPDVSSIEVLKGPQGTLYGRNATGGAILVKTADPTFEPSGTVSASYGSFQEREFKGIISGGLNSERFAASLAAYYKKDDGYLKSAIPDRDIEGVESSLVRGKLLFTPNSDVKLVFAAYVAERRDHTSMAFTNLNGNTNGVLIDPRAITSTYGYSAANNPNYLHSQTTGADLHADFKTGIGTITSITGYTRLDATVIVDGDNSSATGTDFINVFPQKTYSQEVYLTSDKFGPFSFVAGGNYYHDVGYFDPTTLFTRGVPTLNIYSKVRTQALAAYFDGTYALADKLTLTAGLRWTTEKRRHYGAFNNPAFPFLEAKRWNNLSPRVALRYALTDEANLYASYSRGFKSGQFNPTAFVGSASVRPETVDAFEAGVKARLTPSLSFDVAAYHYAYKDIQLSTFANGAQVLQNAARAKIYGLDAQMTYAPSRDLTLTASVSPLHARYASFPNAVIVVPTPSASCPAGLAFCGNRNISADLTGNTLPRAPGITANGSVSYTLHAGRQAVNLFANLYYSGKFYWEASNRVSQKSYVLLNGRISWNVNEGPVSLELWGRNLGNEKYYVSQGIGVSGDGLLSARPRSWGVAARAAF